jgi:hypothetical protein
MTSYFLGAQAFLPREWISEVLGNRAHRAPAVRAAHPIYIDQFRIFPKAGCPSSRTRERSHEGTKVTKSDEGSGSVIAMVAFVFLRAHRGFVAAFPAQRQTSDRKQHRFRSEVRR